MSIERRFTAACELRNADDDDRKTITGYAAVYHRADDDGTEYSLGAGIVEHIMPGAFDDAIGRDDVRALFNHDPDHVLGRNKAGTLRLTADARGLRYEVDMPDTQLARDLRESIRRGDISGSSFAFTIPDGGQEWREDGDRVVREIRAVNLHDVGPVTYPAYESSTTHARACYTKWCEDRNAERATYKGEEIDTTPTDAMVEEAERGLAWRAEYGRGGTEVGVARARDIANRRNLSIDTVQRMASYFARHEVDKDAEGFEAGEDGYPSAGRIAWALWGGDAGAAFARRVMASVAAIDERSEAPEAEPEPEPEPAPGIPADVIIATARLREIDAAE